MQKKDKPNILFMLADDLGWGDVSYHNSPIQTPNIDRLAEQGTVLDQHYVCATCTPTRASLLTGRHPSRFGDHATSPTNAPVLPDGYETIAVSLRNSGYNTGLFGKWHLGSETNFAPNSYGFDYAYGSLAGGVDPYNHCYKKGAFSVTWHKNGKLVKERGHVTDLILQEAVQWMEAQQEPWFCYVPFTAVHIPVKTPQAWIDRYHYETYDLDPLRDQSFKKYAAYASHMDWAVGQLIDTLERMCQLENTIVVFTSDNGAISHYPTGQVKKYPGYQEETPRLGSNLPLRGQKTQLYEGGIRTPTVIYWQGVLGSKTVGAPLHAVDWMPTFTELVGYKPEKDPQWDGVNIWPVISGEKRAAEGRNIFWNIHNREFALRREDWKVITGSEMDPKKTELFNISADPYEKRDMAADNPEKVKKFLEQIVRERRKDDSSKRKEVTAAFLEGYKIR